MRGCVTRNQSSLIAHEINLRTRYIRSTSTARAEAAIAGEGAAFLEFVVTSCLKA